MDRIIAPENLITGAFDQFFEREGLLFDAGREDPNLALAFSLSLSMENFGYEKDGNTHHEEWRRRYDRKLHFIVSSRHRVYVAVIADERSDEGRKVWFAKPWEVPVHMWTNTSNHDSCWRSDGLRIVHTEIRSAYEHCFAWMPEEHSRGFYAACANIHTTWGPGLCNGPLFSIVRIQRKEHEDPHIRQHHYHDCLAKVEEVKLKMEVQ
jgi:hypothetical protein